MVAERYPGRSNAPRAGGVMMTDSKYPRVSQSELACLRKEHGDVAL